MYSQDLPDWEYIFRLSRDMIGFMAYGFLVLQKAILRVCPYFIRLLVAIFNSLSNILCKHLFYYQVRVEQSEPFFHLSCATVPERNQAVPSRRNGDSLLSQKKHTSCLYSRPTLFHSCHRFQVPVQTWTSSKHT
jgi:hypothetical protein